jgi:hypothetical protein
MPTRPKTSILPWIAAEDSLAVATSIKVRTAGVEPAILCSRRPPLRGGARRNTRLSYVLSIKSAQRESNPHFRHGKAAGCRYIMGANEVCRIVKEHSGAPGGLRVHSAAANTLIP